MSTLYQEVILMKITENNRLSYIRQTESIFDPLSGH